MNLENKHGLGEVGSNVEIYEPVVFIKPEVIEIKSNVIISEFAYIAGGNGCYIGNYIHISTQCVVSGGGVFIAEDFVGLSAGVRIITGSEDLSGKGLTNPTAPERFRNFYRSYVVLKKHSFLATNVIVHPGVTIGEGAVVASGSVVTKDLDAWGIYAGTPARRVKDRAKEKVLDMEAKLRVEYPFDSADFTAIEQKCKKT